MHMPSTHAFRRLVLPCYIQECLNALTRKLGLNRLTYRSRTKALHQFLKNAVAQESEGTDRAHAVDKQGSSLVRSEVPILPRQEFSSGER